MAAIKRFRRSGKRKYGAPRKTIYKTATYRRPTRKFTRKPILNSGAKMSYMTARCPVLHDIEVTTSSMIEQDAIRLMIPWQQIPSGGGITGTTIIGANFKATDRYLQCKDNWK